MSQSRPQTQDEGSSKQQSGATRPSTVPVEKVIDFVVRDSQHRTADYLDETTVRHGGE